MTNKVDLNDMEAFTLMDCLRMLAPIKSFTITADETGIGERKILTVVGAEDGIVTKLDITDYDSW
jgi:hypothetical protein